MNLRIKHAWAAQRSDEDFYDFCSRMEKMLHDYNNLGKIAQVEFREVCDSALARERMAIEIFYSDYGRKLDVIFVNHIFIFLCIKPWDMRSAFIPV